MRKKCEPKKFEESKHDVDSLSTSFGCNVVFVYCNKKMLLYILVFDPQNSSHPCVGRNSEEQECGASKAKKSNRGHSSNS